MRRQRLNTRTDEHHGVEALAGLAPALAELHARTGTPITARLPWALRWQAHRRDFEPWTVTVHRDHELVAAALLARRRRAGITTVVAMGDRTSDDHRLPAVSSHDAELLADALARGLERSAGPWRLALRRLPVADAAAEALRTRLPSTALATAEGAPRLDLRPGATFDELVRKGARQERRRSLRRIERAGLRAELAHERDPWTLAGLLPDVLAVWRARDEALGRPCPVDDRHDGPVLRAQYLGLAERGELELTTLRLDGRLAAWTACLLDDPSWRVWNCRFDPAWTDLGVGWLTNAAALDRAIADPCVREFDWMRGEEPYKLRAASRVERAEHLFGWSSAGLRAWADLPRRAAARLAAESSAGREPARTILSAAARLRARTGVGS